MADTMAVTFQNIGGLLEKMQSPDQDYRFMAINDMIVQLQKDTVKLDDDTEQKVVRMLLNLLEDRNGEVQNITVKCLGLLITKVKQERVQTIVASLCNSAMSEKDRVRDISYIGLKTVISQLPLESEETTRNVCECIPVELIKAVKWENVSIQLDALELLAELLDKFGNFVRSLHMLSILKAVTPKLSSPRQAIQKRSVTVCSILVRSCDDLVYKEVIDHIWNGLTGSSTQCNIQSYVQCIAGICREASHRFSPYVEKFVLLILQYSFREDDDTRESCLHTLQVFIQKRPKEIANHLSEIIRLCLDYITYDPNYNYDYEDENEDKLKTDSVDEDSDTYSDDDDTSWKVRRAAAKCIELLIRNRQELLLEFCQILSPALISRFKERDESVKSDIFQAYIALLQQMKSLVNHSSKTISFEKQSSVNMLRQQSSILIKGICQEMTRKSTKTRHDCFTLLKILYDVLPEALNLHVDNIMHGLFQCLDKQKSNNAIMLDALYFIQHITVSPQPEVLEPHINAILPLVLSAIEHEYNKISAEGLLVLQGLMRLMRPSNSSSSVNNDFFLNEIYRCVFIRLKSSDIQIMEQAILTMGQIISIFGDSLQKDLPVCLTLLMDRLKNDISRLTTIKAFTMIAMSPLRVELPIINDVILILSSSLHQNQRMVKLNTLQLLDCLIQNYYDHVRDDYLNHVVNELHVLLNDSELLITQMTLVLLNTLTQHCPAVLQEITVEILPEMMKLLQSPLLQGTVLTSLQQFLQGLVKCNLPDLGYNELLQILLNPILQIPDKKKSKHKHLYDTLSKCVATIAITCTTHTLSVVKEFLPNIKADGSNSLCIFSLLVIGEIGREIDLSSIDNLKNVILQSFLTESKEVKIAASYALGSIAIGNLREYLPFILQEIEGQADQQYLILLSLKELISSLSATPKSSGELLPYISEIWQQLFHHCQSTEEGIRNVISECIGKLTLINPSLLSELEKHVKNPSALVRAVVVLAIKYAILEQPHSIDSCLRQNIGEFLASLQDQDLNVRRSALILFNSIVHNKLFLSEHLLNSILPLIYNETRINETLIQEVKMGPFKHTIDEGLDLRKAAFECMYTLLNSCIDMIDVYEFLNHIEAGLKDHYDIKMLTYLMIERLAQIRPEEVLQEIDNIVEPLHATCTMKISTKSVQQECERLDELKKCAMRTLLTLQKVPNIDKNFSFNGLMMCIKNSPDLALILESHTAQKSNC